MRLFTNKSCLSLRTRLILLSGVLTGGSCLGCLLFWPNPVLKAPYDPYRNQPWSRTTPTLDPPLFESTRQPGPEARDILAVDYTRKDYPPSHRLETSVFVHFRALSPETSRYKNLKFIQIFRNNGSAWHIDENPDGSRQPLVNCTNRGPYPYFPRQYFEPFGINLYDRPGQPPDPAPQWKTTWDFQFPFRHDTLIFKTSVLTFRQDFESCAVAVAEGNYHFLGSVTWGHAFQNGHRISDYFGPLSSPIPDQGTTGELSLRPPSSTFLDIMQKEAPPRAPEQERFN